MAHFAELDANNVVLRVIVVNNSDTSDANGVEKEYIGKAFCERLFGGNWVQTSYNSNFRKRYAGIGFTYDAVRDAFIPPKQSENWVFNESICAWEPPVPMPQDGNTYIWNEATQTWDALPTAPAPSGS